MMRARSAAVDAVRISFFAFTFKSVKSTPAKINLVTLAFLTVALLSLAVAQSAAASSMDDAADRLFDQAGQAQNDGDFEFAAELWDKFLAEHKDHEKAIKARHYAGVCRMTLKQYPKAVAAFTGVINNQDADKLSQLEESYYYLGWCQFSIGQESEQNNKSLEDAIQTFDKHIAKFKNGKFLDQAYFLKAESLYFLGKKADSITAYTKVVNDFKKSTSRPNAIYALGVSQFEVEKYSAAEKTFDLFLTEFKEDSLRDEVKLFKFESILQRALVMANDDKAAAGNLFKQARQGLSDLAQNEEFVKRDEAIFNLALSESRLGNEAQAAKLYTQVATDFSTSPFAKAARMFAGKLFLRAKDYAQAINWFQQVAAKDKENADEANHWICQAWLRQNKPKPAKTHAESSLKSASNAEYLVWLKMDLADAYYELPEGKQESVKRYRQLAEEHPSHSLAPRALYNAAFAALETKQYAEGEKLTESFLSQFDQDGFVPDVKYIRAECFLLRQDRNAASKIYKELIENHADHQSIHAWRVRYGLSLYLQDQYDETIAFLDSVIAEMTEPRSQAEANFLIGASHFYKNDFATSIKGLEVAVTFPKELSQIDEALILLAQAFANQKQEDKALDTLKTLQANHASSRFIPQANYLAGRYLANRKSHDEAIKMFDAVLSGEKNKYTPYAHFGKGWALLNTQKNQTAVAEFTAIIDDSTEDLKLRPDAYYGRAVAFRRTEKFKETIADIESCLKLKPDFANLASALYEKGMAQSAVQDYSAAIDTFARLTKEFESDGDIDEYLYQLAWAYKSAEKTDEAVATFRQLADDFPKSETAAEAHYHVAEDLYRSAKYDQAIKRYELATQADSQEVGEKSRYKLAWSYYQKKEFDEAGKFFAEQVKTFQKGDLRDSGLFMISECLYQQDKFAEAFEEFAKTIDQVIQSKNTNKTEKALACLHAAESANKIRKYDEAIELASRLKDELNDDVYVADMWLELGNAQRGLKDYEQAIESFSKAYDLSTGETGARGGFLVGEVLFEQKKFSDAIRQYKLVIYGYGGTRAADPIKKWQCSSGYETARCYHVQIKSTSDLAQKKKLLEDARKFYAYVVKNHPKDRLAAESRKQLAVLDKIKLQ